MTAVLAAGDTTLAAGAKGGTKPLPLPRAPTPPVAGTAGTIRTLGTQTLDDFLQRVRSSLPEGVDAANSRLKPAHNIIAYCGATIWRNKYSLGIAGGHGDSHDDGHYVQDLATGAWETLLLPSSVASASAPVNTFGEWVPNAPASQHSYTHLVTVGDDIVQGYGYAIGNGAGASPQAHRWKGAAGAWERYGSGGSTRNVPYVVLYDASRNRILRFPLESANILDVIPADDPTASWTTIGTRPWPSIGIYASIGYHAGLDCYVLIDQQESQNQAWVMDPERLAAGWIPVAVTGQPPAGGNAGLEYVPPLRALVAANLLEPNILYYLTPAGSARDPWRWSKESFVGSKPPAPWEVNPGVPMAPFGRIRWSPLLNGLVTIKTATALTEVFVPAALAGASKSSAAAALLARDIVLEDSASGVARDFYHLQLGIPWRGSFIGESLGKTTSPGPGMVRVNLNSYRECLVLRSLRLWANFASRETGTPPVLEVTYRDGTSGTLPCLADSTIDPSMSAGAGKNPALELGVAVLRFAVPEKPVAAVTLAVKAVASAADIVLECCAFVSPIVPAPPPVYGLRARGLSGPTLIHAVDFARAGWWLPWFTDLSVKPTAAAFAGFIVDTDGDTGERLGHKAYCIVNGPAGSGSIIGPNLPDSPSFVFPNNIGRELDEVYFQYRLRFGEGWRGGSTQSGKLPGIASDTTVAGNSGGASNGRNGWSFRGLFVGEPFAADSPYNSNNGVVPIGWYTYNPDQVAAQQLYGIHLPWTGRGSLGVLEVGKDYWIDQYVRVNTPGKNDGVVRGWIDGQLAYERTDHVMRAAPPYQVPGNLAINKIWMTFLHGGDRYPLPTKVLRTYWSDWTIATEYIGPPT